MTSPLSGSGARQLGRAAKSTFLPATITRDGPTTGTPFDPTPGTSTTYACRAVRDTYEIGYRRDSLVGANDVKIIILQYGSETTPQPGDRIAFVATGMGGPWTIVPANIGGQPAITADPANATWECRASS